MSKRNIKVLISDIKEEIERIERFTKGIHTLNEFTENELVYYAILKCLENIGEAVKNMPNDFKSKYNWIDWRKIAGLRDILTHEYFGVEAVIIWDVVKNKIPELKREITNILKEIDE